MLYVYYHLNALNKNLTANNQLHITITYFIINKLYLFLKRQNCFI